jgi:tyrosyl-tRNA synthetase
MNLRDDFTYRGLVHQTTNPELLDTLSRGGVTAYVGFDPTASSLHLGHLLQLCNLRRLQLAGNRPIALAGGGTALIGDPSFKATERPLQSAEQIQANLESIQEQLSRFLDFSPSAGSSQALLLNNAQWLTSIPLTDFLRDVGKHFTINQLIARDSVKSRLDRPDVGLSFTEFSYSLLQGYDFLRLYEDHGCTVQLGGSDQWGNIISGVDLVRKSTGGDVDGLTSPLLLRPDGQKFGKTEGGNQSVWLSAELTRPYSLFQFLLNQEDAMVEQLLKFFTFLDHGAIDELVAATVTAPRERRAQRALATAVVSLVHGDAAAAASDRAGRALFSEDIAGLDEQSLLDVTADAPSIDVARHEVIDGCDLLDLVVRAGLAASKGEARRLFDQGGFSVNNVKVNDVAVNASHLLHDRYIVVRRGARALALVVVR